MKTLFATLATLLLAPLAQAQSQSPPSPLPLEWCLEQAEDSNPAIAVDRESLEAALQRVEPAGSLEDPRLAYEASNVPRDDRDFDSTPLSGHQFDLRQKVPFPGLLSSREGAASAAAEAAEHSLSDRRLVTATVVEAAWAELGFAQRSLRITNANVDLVRDLTAIAEVKYSVGTGLQQDVLRAQVRLTSLLNERLQRQAAMSQAAARLAALLDLPLTVTFPPTAQLEDAAPLPSLEPLVAALDETSPALRSLSAKVKQAGRLVRVAELEGYPDFDLGVGYRIRKRVAGDPADGDDFLRAGVTVRLPINRSKWRAKAAEKRALLRREQARHRGLRAQLVANLRSAYADLVRADSEATLLRTGLVPQARQSLESSRSGYEVGRIDFLSLLDSQLRALDADLRHVRALADRRLAFAALEAAAGEKLR
jgi:outer membrane protein TolC